MNGEDILLEKEEIMRKALSLALVGVMAFSLVGCGGQKDEAKKSEGVTLKVTTTYAGEDTNAQNYVDAYKEWEEKTGNTIKDSSATSDEAFKSRVLTDFEAGSEPDVLFFFNGVDANPIVEQGKVVSIEEIRKEYPDYASNMKDDLMGASPVDGKNYSVPVNGFWETLFVNNEVLKEAGVEAPTAETTYDEFLDMCAKIKKAGYTPIAVSLQQVPHYWFEYTIFNNDTLATHLTTPAKVDDAAGKAWEAGLKDIKDLYEAGYLPENTLTATDDETFQMFTSDKAAFLIDGSWKVGGIEEAVDDIENFSVTYMPAKNDRKNTEIIGGISMGYYITQKCWEDETKRAAAVDFITHMTSDEKVALFAGSSLTALKAAPEVDESAFTALGKSALEFSAGVTGVVGAVQDNYTEAAREPIFANMAKIVKGDEKITDAIQKVIDKAAE